jgi:phospholipid/cholesterol/gamma-HCH transport system substrate-binding protein
LAKFDELMSAQSGKIGRILNNVEETTKGLAANAGKIDRAIDNLDKFSQNLKDVELKTTITKLNAASDEILTMVNKINRGEGNLGKLIHDDSLYESLLETNAAVQMLLEDIRVYPSRYLHFSVFGTKEKGAKLSAREQQYLKEVLDLNKGGVIKMSPEEERKLRDMLGI